jgi:hypothetical protein
MPFSWSRKFFSYSGPRNQIRKDVINITEQAEGLWIALLHTPSSGVLQNKVAPTGDSREFMAVLSFVHTAAS